MFKELMLMLHVMFGVLALLAAVWVFVDTLHASRANDGRIRIATLLVAVLIWLSYLIGGYWYVTFYGADKALIKAGPWSFAHSFFMEAKEHIFLMLLLLATFLPIAAFGDIAHDRSKRHLVLWTAALVIILSLAMEGAGAVISMGLKVSLLANSV
ncbi:hypothetical protein [Photobacterium atrarenae]|uniref:DUF2269 domain-containing protein n=1 Tax=Photobacterium atrarenae TaxID=865757 RepID=A0ABY5GP23_9GAMM|nr:hypothetical protein [Photobacterium atrarenae]UTV30977.1 hypothetical protein NNL38_24530 [Photobacterium atrarenae]